MNVARTLGIATLLLTSAVSALAQCEPVWSSLDGRDGYGGESLAVHDEDGRGPRGPALFIGNGLEDVRLVARWDGWDATVAGGGPFDPGVQHLEPIPDSIGNLAAGLYAGGDFTMIGGLPVNGIARWDRERWHDVGGGIAADFILVKSMAVFDEDGQGGSPPVLFVGGRFETVGGPSIGGLLRWDGVSWTDVGGGVETYLPGRTIPTVNALQVYDDGRGPALYVGGTFASAGGKECWNIARWDGAAWEPVGPGLNGSVKALRVFDEDGPGPKQPMLFAGGGFSEFRGGEKGSMRGIGRWDSVGWSHVGEALNVGSIWTLVAWDQDGPGPARECLYVGGTINRVIGSIALNNLVRWDGQQWHDVGGGVTGFGAGTHVNVLVAFDEDGSGPNPGGLYVGGAFYYAGEVYSKHIARWGCPLPPTPPCYADCDGSGDLTFFDFLCFQNLFAAMDPGADCDGDGSLTFFDFLCYQNAFAAGCP